jgi:translation elongation factor P/translation initiation factor 5A
MAPKRAPVLVRADTLEEGEWMVIKDPACGTVEVAVSAYHCKGGLFHFVAKDAFTWQSREDVRDGGNIITVTAVESEEMLLVDVDDKGF